MELNEKQLEMCTASRWDFSDLRAIFLNCTLKKSPEMSHTEGLWQICKAIFEKNGVQVDELRVIDHQVAFGVWGDTTEHGYQRDDWPQIYTRVKEGRDHRRHRLLDLARREDVCVHDAHRAALRQLTPAERARPVCRLRQGGWVPDHRQRGRRQALLDEHPVLAVASRLRHPATGGLGLAGTRRARSVLPRPGLGWSRATSPTATRRS